MAQALLIGPEERARIAKAIEMARAEPVTAEEAKKLAETVMHQNKSHVSLEDIKTEEAGGYKRPKKSIQVDLPIGYTCCVSFEEQPAGLCIHLSVSVDREGMLPSPEAFMLIAQEFGITNTKTDGAAIWTEEFRPGQRAVNVVRLYKEAAVVGGPQG